MTMTHWKGRPVEDLSRDELLEVVQDLAGRLRLQHEQHRRDFDTLHPASSRRVRRPTFASSA